MSINKNKIIAAAQKLVQRGAFDKAIREYQRLVDDDPKDVRTLLKIGDLYVKRGDPASAAKTYERVAQAYSEQGFYLKAVAVYKQILKVDPAQVEINRKLAELYHQLGLLSDSMTQYQTLAGFYERQGRTKDTIAIYKRMVELDPENVASRVKLAELHSREEDNDLAVAEFEKACEQLFRQARSDDYVKVAERLLYLDPTKVGEARRLAKVYLDRADTKRALSKLQLCFKADPRDIETLKLLGDAFRDLNQTSKTVSVLKELATIYGEQGMTRERDETWHKVLEHVPDDPDARAALGASARAPAEAAEEGSGEIIEKLLNEVDVYARYGLYQKAKEHLDQLFRVAPEHPEGLERLSEVCLSLDDRSGAVGALLRLADQNLLDEARLRRYVGRALQIDPGHPQARALLGRVGEGPTVALPAPPAAPPPIGATPFGEEIIIVDEGESSEETVFGPPPDLAPSVASPVPSASPPAPVEEEEEIETLDIDELIEEVPDEEAAASGREEVDLGLDDKTRVAPPVAEVGRGEVRPRTDDEVASELEEAEFFQHQGLLEEARIILGELARARPGREDIAAKLREVETGLAVAGAAEAPAAPPPVEGAQAIVLDEMFEELSPQAELPPTLEDCETHYDLGIAYKEMGLIDDAIAEFRLAMRSPVRELSAMERIGTCYLEKKRFEDAVRELKRGLASSRITEVAAVDFYFGLGLAYEGLGDDREALYYFRRVAAANAAYRDVQQRIERLSQGASRSGGEAAATALRRKG